MSKGLDKGRDPGTYPGGHDVGRGNEKPPETTRTPGRARVAQTRKHPPKAPPLARRLYDLKAIADYLGIPVYSVRTLIWNGSLSCVRFGWRLYLDLKDVDALIELNKERAGTGNSL